MYIESRKRKKWSAIYLTVESPGHSVVVSCHIERGQLWIKIKLFNDRHYYINLCCIYFIIIIETIVNAKTIKKLDESLCVYFR